MNLDEIKKLSEIFNNFAQPIATVIAGLHRLQTCSKQQFKVAKEKEEITLLLSFHLYYITTL